mgnify:CR=1 FL=1
MGRFGLIGRALGHSFSPAIHALIGDYEYKLYPLEPEALDGFLRASDGDGFNVTIPYKIDAMRSCRELSERARAIGCVNTVTRLPDGEWRGDNTDWDGFLHLLGEDAERLRGRPALVLGNGGASRTVRAVLASCGIPFAVISRSGDDTYATLERHADAELIVNTTPVGMYPKNGVSPVDLRLFPRCRLVLDVIYNPLRTALLLQAEELGLPARGGLAMLAAQAVRAGELFLGRELPATLADRITAAIARRTGNVALIGMPGCGKTTTLRIIGGFLTPTSGTVTFDGKVINDVPPYKRQINTVFQRYALFPHLDVYDNVAFGLKVAKLPKDEVDRRVNEMLEIVSLKGYENRSVDSLSGGQQQRVAIARALVNQPKVLLLDEPLAALDLRLRKDMQIELKRIQQTTGITFIYVTHDQEEALSMSDTVVVMDKGRIQQIGRPEDIYNEPKNAFVADFIGESNILDGVMLEDFKVRFFGRVFECVDKGFAPNEPVDVVIRPEDIDIVKPAESHLVGTVTGITFKGLNYDIIVEFKGFKWLIQTTDYHGVGETIGIRLNPEDIHIMHKSEYSGLFGDYSSYSAEYDELTEDAEDEEE